MFDPASGTGVSPYLLRPTRSVTQALDELKAARRQRCHQPAQVTCDDCRQCCSTCPLKDLGCR